MASCGSVVASMVNCQWDGGGGHWFNIHWAGIEKKKIN